MNRADGKIAPMKRSRFLSLAAAVPLLGTATCPGAAQIVDVPAELRGGRFFAVPKTLDGRTFACWLDTNGSGFIFDWAVSDFGLQARDAGNGHRIAALPAFSAAASVPALPSGNPDLMVFDRSRGDRRDPVLAGFAAQLGGSWFANRVWRLDFPGKTLALLPDPLPAQSTTATLGFDRVYPQVQVVAGSQSVLMALDIAASVSYRAEARDGGPQVQATSFITRATFEAWRAAYPQWTVELGVGTSGGVDRITVPQLRVGTATLRDVAFTTRPNDDVFAGEPTQGKLGANAYADRIVIIDYPNGRLALS